MKDDKQWTWKGQATDMEWKLASVKGANVEVHCLDACEPGFSPGLGGHESVNAQNNATDN